METLYGSDGTNKEYGLLSEEAIKLLDLSNVSERFKTTFLGGNK